MFYMKRKDILYRSYDSFYYITDNRNFSYIDVKNIVGDIVLSGISSYFMGKLEFYPKKIDDIVNELSLIFIDVEFETLFYDAREIFDFLSGSGFISSGVNYEECIFNSKKNHRLSSTQDDKSTLRVNDTEEFFSSNFKKKNQLTSLHIEITGKCNEKCIHCYIPNNFKLRNIESDLLFSILEQCKLLNVLHVTISGGEPMLHKDFYKVLKWLREENFSVTVLSNLTLLTDDIICEMKENTLLGVQVSLYSMDSEIHDSITKLNGSFLKTKNAILKLIENNIPLQISCPVMKQNFKDYEKVVLWCKSLNLKINYDYEIIAGYDNTIENTECRLSLVEIEDVMRTKVKNESGYIEVISEEIKNKRMSRPTDVICSVCYSSLCISENGNVYPCPGWQGNIVGNLKESSLKSIWNDSSKVNELRRLQKKDASQCLNCKNKDFCTMCMARNANENKTGDPFIVSKYFCDIANSKKSMYLKNRN